MFWELLVFVMNKFNFIVDFGVGVVGDVWDVRVVFGGDCDR